MYLWSILNNKTMHKIITKSVMTLSVAVLVFAFSACNNDKENAQRLKDAAMQLDQTKHTFTDLYDYWPECGIRVTGSHLASLISLEELEKMLPAPLYVSGPHQDGQWDLDNEDEFGHYNPKAIQYLAKLAKNVVADKQFVEASKPLVDEYLYDKMLIMMAYHDALYSNDLPKWLDYNGSTEQAREEILGEIVENHGYQSDISSQFYSIMRIDVDSWTGNGSNENFLYFWARRWADGTIDHFYDALNTIFKAYHPEYVFNMEDYYWESEYDGWYEEEEFEGGPEYHVVIDGSDLRLRLGPSTSADTFKWPDGTNRHPKVGERFPFLGEEGDFYQIEYYGNMLWVSKQFTHVEE